MITPAGAMALAVSPYVKIPTANQAIGNGKVEVGLIVPVQFTLPGNWQLLFDPELDALENSNGDGRHVSVSGLISLSRPISKTVTLSGELWSSRNFDPSRTVTQASADLGAAWVPAAAPNLQLDAGLNLGLNGATPALQAYVGISRRF